MIRTVKTFAEIHGARERGEAELVRLLSLRYGVRFRVEHVGDEPQPVSGLLAAHSRPHEGTEGRHAA